MEEIGIRRECEELPFFVKRDKTPLVQEGKKIKNLLYCSLVFCLLGNSSGCCSGLIQDVIGSNPEIGWQ